MIQFRAYLAAASAVAVAACASSGPTLGPGSSAVEVRSALPAPDAGPSTALGRNFVVGPFDTIKVQVLSAQELTREGMVDAAGNFSLPLVGQIAAAGKTPGELEALVADRLRGRYLRDPIVTVSIIEVLSQTVTIDGSVRQPGAYPVTGPLTLQQAVALARGPDQLAKLEEVVIFRTVSDTPMAARFDLGAIRAGQVADPQIYRGDIVIVGKDAARQRFLDIVQALPVLGVFTPVVR